MADKSYKNAFDEGYTTYHENGKTSKTYSNFSGNGYTTQHSDGSTSKSYKNNWGDGYTTYHDDGSSSKTYKNSFDDGYTTIHSNGNVSKSYKNLTNDGYTTYTDPGAQAVNDLAGTAIICLFVIGSIASLLILKNGFIIFCVLIASILIRVKLNQKRKTQLFTLWLYPISLLSWRLLVNSWWVFEADPFNGVMAALGLFGILLALIGSLFIDNGDKPLIFVYCIVFTVIIFFLIKTTEKGEQHGKNRNVL